MAAVAMLVRPMSPDDIDEVADLEAAVFPQPWSRGVFADELAQPTRTYLVAEGIAGRIVGYAGLMVLDEDAHITTIAVAEGARGKRLGSRLMLRLAEMAIARGAAHLTLEVRMSNEPARRLYSRFGFAPVGVRKNYYVDEDALIMWAHEIGSAEYGLRLDEIRSECS